MIIYTVIRASVNAEAAVLGKIQLLLLLVAAGALLLLLRRVAAETGGRAERRRMLARLDAEARTGADVPEAGHPCPLCGSPSVFHRYPHIEVWRCSRYPECRGFQRVRARRRPAFALKWEAGRGRNLKKGS